MTTVGPIVSPTTVQSGSAAAQLPAASQALFTVQNTPALNLSQFTTNSYEISNDIQKLLMDNLSAISKLNKQRGIFYPNYERTIMLDGQPHEIVNTLTSVKGADKFTNIRPEELSSLVPMMKFYKIEYDDDGFRANKNKPLQITFDTHTKLGNGTGRLMQTSKSGVGIKSFEWQLNGSNKVARASDITAKLVLYFQNFNELLTPRPGGFAYYDLLARPPRKDNLDPTKSVSDIDLKSAEIPADISGRELDPKFYEIQAVVGWAYNNDYIYDFNKKSGLADAVLRQRRTFFLTLEDHEFNINQDGTFTLTINYRARMSATLADSNKANILVDRQVRNNGGPNPLVFGATEDVRQAKQELSILRKNKARYEKMLNEGIQLTAQQQIALDNFDSNVDYYQYRLDLVKDQLILNVQRSIITRLFDEERIYYAKLETSQVQAIPTPLPRSLNVGPVTVVSNPSPLAGVTIVPSPASTVQRTALLLKLPESNLGVKEQLQIFSRSNSGSSPLVTGRISSLDIQEIIETQFELDQVEEKIKRISPTPLVTLLASNFNSSTPLGRLIIERDRLQTKIRNLNLASTPAFSGASGTGPNQKFGPRGLIQTSQPGTAIKYEAGWFYYGDLIDIVAQNAFDNFLFEHSTDLRKTGDVDKLMILLGSIQRDSPNLGLSSSDLVNIGDMPVSLNLFRQFWKTYVTNPGKETYAINDFIRDSIKYFFVEDLIAGTGALPNKMVHPSDTTITLPESPQGQDPLLEKAMVPHGNMLLSSRVKLEELKDDPPNHKVQTTTTSFYEYKTYYISSRETEFLNGNKREDAKSNIMHLNIGRDRGLVKSVQFSRETTEGFRELRVTQADPFDPLSNLTDLYNVTITMFGNVLFWPGQYVYINPISLGTALGNPSVEGSKSRILGLGGYHLITNVSSFIESGQYETTIEAKWETSGGKNSRSLRNSIAERERRAKEANSSLPTPGNGTI